MTEATDHQAIPSPTGNGRKRETTEIHGIPASPGIAIGPVYLHDPGDFWIDYSNVPRNEVDAEVARFFQALKDVAEELSTIREQVEAKLGREHAQIFDAQILMLQDSAITGPTEQRIRDYQYHAEYAYRVTMRQTERQFDAIQDPYLRSRKSDILEIEKRVMARLCRREEAFLDRLDREAVVVANDLAAADMIQMRSSHVLGIVCEGGGRTSHTAIMARGLEIPAVVGVGKVVETLEAGDTAIVDGIRGILIINPDDETLARYRTEVTTFEAQQKDLEAIRDLPAVTVDGTRVQLMVNIELPMEADTGLAYGAEGVGLFRTEFLYLMNSSHPSEEEQTAAYMDLAERMSPHPVVIRTLDLGGDKLPYLGHPSETNPFLGWRAIRVSLANRGFFRAQLRAMLRATASGDVRILFPMISGVGELKEALQVLEEAKEELRTQGVPFNADCQVGAMIEVPSAAIVADQLAEHVDFFSIGTNDLIQYTLAVDRGNQKVAYLFDPYHPAVLRLIKTVAEAGHARGIPVTVCGEMAGDPYCALMLLGLGIDGLSVSPPSLPEVKRAIRSIDRNDAVTLAEKALKLESRDDIRSLLSETLGENPFSGA